MHLKPDPYNRQHSHLAARILGKLGGFNRRLLIHAPELENSLIHKLEASFMFDPLLDSPKMIALDDSLNVACSILKLQSSELFYYGKSFEFLKGCVPLLFDVDEGSEYLYSSLQSRLDSYNRNRVKGVTPMDVDEENKADPFPEFPPASHGVLAAHSISISKVLDGLFHAASIESLKEEAAYIIENINRHFALLCIAELISQDVSAQGKPASSLDAILSTPSTRFDGFIDGIVCAISSDIVSVQNLAMSCLSSFYEICLMFLGSSEAVEEIKVFKSFASKFCSSCYQLEWSRKTGGCHGISLLTEKLQLSQGWILEHEIEFIKALLFVLKDTCSDFQSLNVEDVKRTLFHVLNVCHISSRENERNTSKFNALISLLISELANSNSVVRETIKSSFQLLAGLIGSDVTDFLSPVRDRLVSPIFAKPLRALPLPMEIGNIEAITYCLSLRPSLLVFNDELVRLLHEALALADAEEVVAVGKPSPHKNVTSLMNLRVVCIKLLSTALACSDFNNTKLNNLRARIIGVFFKSLYSPSADVVDVSYRGLQLVLSMQHKLPKELLQQGLRPSLVSISSTDSSKLTVSSLEGLARLLDLLTNYFKVEIGRKLLDHLKNLAEPAALEEASSRPLTEIDKINVIVCIINVFYLLPAAANIFLEELILSVIDLETKLRRFRSSPFRTPLIKYLNRYATESVAHFYSQLGKSEDHNRLFVGVLGLKLAAELRSDIVNSTPLFLSSTFESPDRNVKIQGVYIIFEIYNYHPEWLENEIIIKQMHTLWRSEISSCYSGDSVVAADGALIQKMLGVFIAYLEKHENAMIVIDLIEALDLRISIEQDDLKKFIFEFVCLKYSTSSKRMIFNEFLKLFQTRNVRSEKKILLLRMLIIPMLMMPFESNTSQFEEIVDAKVVDVLDSIIWVYSFNLGAIF